MRANYPHVVDESLPEAERVKALRKAMANCYCGWGPDCVFWRRMTPEERERCALDKRGTAQWYYQNGM